MITKTIEEYQLFVDGLDFLVHSRIVELLDDDGNGLGEYEWDISHYCKPSESAATVYIPSNRQGPTMEHVKTNLISYLSGFTAIDVESNPFY